MYWQTAKAMVIYTHKQTKEAKNMVIKRMNEFYYDENIRHYLFVLSKLTNKQKLQFLQGMQEAINSLPDKNITAIRLWDTLQLMYKAVQKNETITLEGWKALYFFFKNVLTLFIYSSILSIVNEFETKKRKCVVCQIYSWILLRHWIVLE